MHAVDESATGHMIERVRCFDRFNVEGLEILLIVGNIEGFLCIALDLLPAVLLCHTVQLVPQSRMGRTWCLLTKSLENNEESLQLYVSGTLPLRLFLSRVK